MKSLPIDRLKQPPFFTVIQTYQQKRLEYRLFQSLFDLTAADRGHVNAKFNLLTLMRIFAYDVSLFHL